MEGRAEVLPELADELLQWALSYRSQAAARLQTLGRPTLPPPPAVGAARQAISGEVAGGEHDARKRILLAASELAVRTGYRALTIERITAAAGVRRRTFSALFEDREDCFLHAFELQGDRALRLVSVAGLSNATGPGGLYRAVAALMEHTARDPVFAGVSFVEIFAVGPAGLPVRERRMERLADGIMDAACSPSGPPRELTLQASVGAVWGIVHHHVANGKAAELPALAGELSYMLLAPILGPEEAVKTILAEHAMLAAAATRSEH
jgi:AcrR family transcriptional regulator